MHRLASLLFPLSVALFVLGCEGGGASDKGGGGSRAVEAADPYPGCGQSQASRFYVARLQLLVDPVDFAGESWDWDGGGIAEFWSEYDWFIEFVATYTGYGEAYDVVDMLIPYVDEAAPLLASPYVSPDPRSSWGYFDGDSLSDGYDEVWHADDQNLLEFSDLEVDLPQEDHALVVEVYDRDLAFDDYVGWELLGIGLLRLVADCGPFTYVYTDSEMSDYESRIRAIGIEVESW